MGDPAEGLRQPADAEVHPRPAAAGRVGRVRRPSSKARTWTSTSTWSTRRTTGSRRTTADPDCQSSRRRGARPATMAETPCRSPAHRREFGDGPLVPGRRPGLHPARRRGPARCSPALPGLVPLVLLDRDASNLPLAAVCALPARAGRCPPRCTRCTTAARPDRPATRRRRSGAATGSTSRGVLRLWVPWLAWLTVIAVNLAHFAAAGLPALVGGAAGGRRRRRRAWGANALVITSLFAFRARDVARLAAYFLCRTRGVTLGQRLPAGRRGRRDGAVLRGRARAAGSRARRCCSLLHQPPDDRRDPGGVHRMSLPATRRRSRSAGTTTPSSGPRRCGSEDYRLFDAGRHRHRHARRLRLGADPARRGRLRLLDARPRSSSAPRAEGRTICLATGTGAPSRRGWPGRTRR